MIKKQGDKKEEDRGISVELIKQTIAAHGQTLRRIEQEEIPNLQKILSSKQEEATAQRGAIEVLTRLVKEAETAVSGDDSNETEAEGAAE